MTRRLTNLLTGLSLLLFVAAVSLWVRSYWFTDEWALRRGGKVWVVQSSGGLLHGFSSRLAATPAGWSWRTRGSRGEEQMAFWKDWPDTHVRLPHLAVATAAGVLPTWRLLVRRPRGAWRPTHWMLCASLQVAAIMAGFAVAAGSDYDQYGPAMFFGLMAVGVAAFCVRDLIRIACAEAGRPPPWRPWARRRWSSAAAWMCRRCGYNLTGNASGTMPRVWFARGDDNGMKRRPLNLLTALSLLLCVAVCVLWVRSYRVEDSLTRATWERADSISLSEGRVVVEWLVSGKPQPAWFHETCRAGKGSRRTGDDFRGEVGGFHLLGVEWSPGVNLFAVSLGWPFGFLSLSPLAGAMARRRIAQGRCPRCRYDLRATPGRCPECGTETRAPGCVGLANGV